MAREYEPDASPCRIADEHRCPAHLKASRRRCRQPRIEGAPTCRMHGSAAPQVRAAAARRVLDQQAAAALARLDVDPVADPLTELSRLAGQVCAWRDALAAKVNALTDLRFEDAKGAEQLRSEVALWERALDRCGSLLTAIARLGIDERLARISERQADAVIRALDAGLAAAGVTGDSATEARKAAARALRIVT